MTQIFDSESGGSVRTKLNNTGLRKNNFTGSDPTVTNDSDEGYDLGSQWLNTTTGDPFILVDKTDGAAVWNKLVDSDQLATLQTQVDSNQTNLITLINNALGGSEWQGIAGITAYDSSFTLALTNSRDILELTSAGAIIATIPDSATVPIQIGTIINMTRINSADSIEIVAGAGVSLNGVLTGSALMDSGDYNGVSMYKRASDAWVVQGSIGTVA